MRVNIGWLAFPLVMLGAWPGALGANPLPEPSEMRESVVRILVETDNGGASGTGFIINNHRAIATNNHVVEGAKSIAVAFLAGGKAMTVPARVVDTNPEKDLAIIEALFDIFGEPVTLASYNTNPPAKVTAVGYPGAADDIPGADVVSVLLEPSYSVGTVARVLGNVAAMGGDRLIQHTAIINHGNSGGPLFDECGRVIGINSLAVAPTEQTQYAQGIFYSIDVRELLPMLEANLIDARIASKPCTPGTEARNDLPQIDTKEAEAPIFDRFAACISARPCDADICKQRYGLRVSSELAAARQADIGLRMAASGALCTRQKEAEAYDTFLSCADSNPCDFDNACAANLQQSLRPEIMRKRQVLLERARGKAQEECRQASAPGVWHSGQIARELWQARVFNDSKAALVVTCAIDGENAGNGVFEVAGVGGKRERWTGTRSVRMTIDTYSEPLSLDLQSEDGSLEAEGVFRVAENEPGAFKELLGKLTVGGVVAFNDPRVGLDETFSLDGSRDALTPCLKVKQVAQQEQNQKAR